MLYSQLPDTLLAGFFIEINKKINEGTLSEAMHYEIYLINKEIKRRKISDIDLEKIYQKYKHSIFDYT
ncbi:hypothetical protein [Bacillus wiedmannii]|uniref:hypothetical protein n=1 Tax=Bacillus wiedmannii TaxID=1890302 RepID=UPI000B44BF4E|nr:hypothetical protein [Bacillus wiedmannii]OUB80906.1 hypothetical protein BK788_25040 [Bacillus thuringiensis serovar sinensis]